MTASALRHAVRGDTWADLTDPPPVVLEDPAARQRKLTAAQVAEARRSIAAGTESVAALAIAYRCSEAAVESAVYGRTWRSMTDPPPLQREPAGRSSANARLTEADVKDARRRFANEESGSSIAADYDVALTTILNAIHGLTWAYITDPPPVPIGLAGWCLLGTEDIERAAELREAGHTLDEIGDELDVDKSTVSRALRR